MNVSGVGSQGEVQESQRNPQSTLGKDAFLQILTAQMKYQDPLSGGNNTTESISQMAQFSSLEQMQNLNEGFSRMLYYQNAQYASQLIGKQVTLSDGDQMIQGIVEKTKIVNGDVRIVIDGKSYWVEQITQIENAETTSEEGIASKEIIQSDVE